MNVISNSDLDSLKKDVQSIFGDGLVTIIGSGLSCAEGLPGMAALGAELSAKVPAKISGADADLWTLIEASLPLDGLEGALQKHPPTDSIESAIIEITAAFVGTKERSTFEDCLNSGRKLKLAYLLPHISASNPKIANIITTNYDRLIEFAAESEGWGVDTMMVGRYWGKHDPDLSSKLLVKSVSQGNKGVVKLNYRNHVRLFKPHGSLDWFLAEDTPISCVLPISGHSLIITPGVGKYRRGYGQPFDVHRERGNAAIDGATSILCIGYGFNDDHLQTHLLPKLRNGTKALLLTRDLSPNARDALAKAPDCTAFVNSTDPTKPGTVVVHAAEEELIPNVSWWDAEHFVKGVLTT